MRVFVTGGAGVIGLELIPRLVGFGADVLVGDLKPQPEVFRGRVRYRQGDLNDLTSSELLTFDPEIVIHLAATFERSTETLGFWEENFHNNVKLSHHLITLARRCAHIRRVVFASSYLIYDQSLYQFDTPQVAPRSLGENDPIRPRNLIGMAKLAHEQELHFLGSFSDCRFSTLCVRIFRGYGCHSRDVISRWIRCLIRDERIKLYRSEGFFDYIYAADSAEGLLRLAMCDQATGIVNLGTGRARRVAEIVEVLQTHFPTARIEHADADIPYEASQACTERLEKLIGWVPSRTLETTIPEMINFEREQLRLLTTFKRQCTPPVCSVLVTSASRKIPLIRALKRAALRLSQGARVVAGDIDEMAPAQFEADDFWQMPRLRDEIVSDLIDGCRHRAISIVIPTRDGELDFWARHRDVFAQAGVAVLVSSSATITRCRDKLAFAQFGADAGLPIIPAATKPDPFDSGQLVVKERFGAGSRGLGLNLTRHAAVKHARYLDEPIFQPFVPGPEISIDGWADSLGRVAGVVLRRRDRVVSGESQVTTTFRDVDLEEQAKCVLTALELRGPVVLQAIVVDDMLQVIECNPRFGGASTASIAVGLDSLYWSLSEALGGFPPPIFQRMPSEIRQVRMPMDRLLYDSCF